MLVKYLKKSFEVEQGELHTIQTYYYITNKNTLANYVRYILPLR